MIRAVTGKSLDELNLTPKQRKTLEEFAVFKPLPFVRRVTFICTPHRGSLPVNSFVRNLVRNMMALPVGVAQTIAGAAATLAQIETPDERKAVKIGTSIDSMDPHNPALLALADIPVAPGVIANSIIAVKHPADYKHSNDGVVKYTSAHIDYAESEFIVKSGHSCQSNPLVVEEVRRILLKHAAEFASREKEKNVSTLSAR